MSTEKGMSTEFSLIIYIAVASHYVNISYGFK